MDSGELIYIAARLVLGSVAALLAIVLWSKTRDGAWMLAALAVVASYIEIVYSVLELLGVTRGLFITIGTTDLLKLILSCLPPLFFIFAFALMAARKTRPRRK